MVLLFALTLVLAQLLLLAWAPVVPPPELAPKKYVALPVDGEPELLLEY